MNVKEKISYLPSAMAYQGLLKRDIKSIAVEFEAILLKEILKEAFRPMLSGESFEKRMYYDIFLDNISKKLAEGGGIGIANFILNNMQKWEG
ncbi:MAG: hypothetical protein ACK4UR_05305 [Caldimicrobium sp.]